MVASSPPFQRLLSGYVCSPDTGCWLWEGHKYPNGYGAIKAFGKMVLAHRLSYELHKGPIPDGLQILHSCDVRHCINPDHLSAGTHAENMREAAERGRMPSGSRHSNFGRPSPRRGHKSRQSRQVQVLGRCFGSMNEAERTLGLGSGTVGYWLKHHPDKAKVISKEEYLRNA